MSPNISSKFNFLFSDSFSLVFWRSFWLPLYLGFERLCFWHPFPARQRTWGRRLSLLCHLFDLFQWHSIFLPSWIAVCAHLCLCVCLISWVFFPTVLWGHFLHICIYLWHLLISSAEVVVIISLLSYLEFSVMPVS